MNWEIPVNPLFREFASRYRDAAELKKREGVLRVSAITYRGAFGRRAALVFSA